MKRILITILILLAACAAWAGTEKVANVMDFGAKGDAIADDTLAFKKAIIASREQKIPVFAPRGNYRITDTLELMDQSLKGGEPGGWNADATPMARLFIDQEKGPGVHMKDYSSLYGIAIVYSENKLDTHFPPAIYLDGNGINIQNLRLQYCWDGIACNPKNGPGRVNIENVFVVSCGGCAVTITGTLDIPTLRNIEVWNNLNRPNVTAFRFGYNDGISCWRLFSMNNQTGFQTIDPPKEWPFGDTGSWGTFVDCATDATSISWDIQGKAKHQLGITGGLYWGHHKFLQVTNPNADVTVSGCQLSDNGDSAIHLADAGDIILSGCRFGRSQECQYPFIRAEKGKSLIVTGCSFSERSSVLSIYEGMEMLSFTGNIIKPSEYPFLLVDRRSGTAAVTIANNTGNTDSVGKPADGQ
ncbi:MAG: right-handed parallel beta-helix repeat-containing protein [Abditibacteriota bacterium]|nr:right-handed parallel beta-helix repeat-containing protein [Abditibacteriota bacterium]